MKYCSIYVLNEQSTTPVKLLGHFQATQEAHFRYATLFWANYKKYEEKSRDHLSHF